MLHDVFDSCAFQEIGNSCELTSKEFVYSAVWKKGGQNSQPINLASQAMSQLETKSIKVEKRCERIAEFISKRESLRVHW
jgi:hypothetical protein